MSDDNNHRDLSAHGPPSRSHSATSSLSPGITDEEEIVFSTPTTVDPDNLARQERRLNRLETRLEERENALNNREAELHQAELAIRDTQAHREHALRDNEALNLRERERLEAERERVRRDADELQQLRIDLERDRAEQARRLDQARRRLNLDMENQGPPNNPIVNNQPPVNNVQPPVGQGNQGPPPPNVQGNAAPQQQEQQVQQPQNQPQHPPPQGQQPPPPPQQPPAAVGPQAAPPAQPAPVQNPALQQIQHLIQGMDQGEIDRFLRQNNFGGQNAIRPTAREPPVFHGTNDENFERFIREVERFAAAVGWTDAQTARNVPFMFQGRALQVYDTVPDNVKGSWTQLIAHLRNIHPFARNRQAFAFDSLTRMQNPGESVAAYTHDMLNIFADAGIQDEDLKVWIYKKGLLPAYRPYVLLQDAQTLHDAERDALKAERVNRSGQLTGQTHGLQVNYLFNEPVPVKPVVPQNPIEAIPPIPAQSDVQINQIREKIDKLTTAFNNSRPPQTDKPKPVTNPKPNNNPPRQQRPRNNQNQSQSLPPPVVNYNFPQPTMQPSFRPPSSNNAQRPYYNQGQRFRPPRPPFNPNQNQNQIQRFNSNQSQQQQQHRFCRQCQQRHPERQHTVQFCFNCGQTGHFRRECPTRESEN